MLQVTFVGESGVDLGGIKWEFFGLFTKELGKSIFMQGAGKQVVNCLKFITFLDT